MGVRGGRNDVTPSASQLSATSRLFSSAVVREIANRGRSASFARLFKMAELHRACSMHATVGDGFNAAFNLLRKCGRRDEYVYLAALTHKVLLRTHSLNTASMLTEFRAGNCKADVVILNGTTTAYEIKSERDSLCRLANQIMNYRRVFASVNVIACEAHLSGVLRVVPNDVGVLCLSSRYTIRKVRSALELPQRVCPTTLFDSLRSAEARAVLRKLKIDVPDVPNTRLRSEMRAIFSGLEGSVVHNAAVDVLKKTRDLAPLNHIVAQLPASLQPAALTMKAQGKAQAGLLGAMSIPLSAAMAWV
jgi:hypothetical protein